MEKVIKFPCITRMKIPGGNIEQVITGKIIVWLENYMPCEFDIEPVKLSLKYQNIRIIKTQAGSQEEPEVGEFSCFLQDDRVVCFIKIQAWLFLVESKCSVMLMVANYCLLAILEIRRAALALF